MNLSILEISYNQILLNVSSFSWHNALSVPLLCSMDYHYFSAFSELIILLLWIHHIFFIHSSLWQIGFLPFFLAIMNRGAMNICIIFV